MEIIGLLSGWTWTISRFMYSTAYVGSTAALLQGIFGEERASPACSGGFRVFEGDAVATLSPCRSLSALLDGKEAAAPSTGMHALGLPRGCWDSSPRLSFYPYCRISGRALLVNKMGW